MPFAQRILWKQLTPRFSIGFVLLDIVFFFTVHPQVNVYVELEVQVLSYEFTRENIEIGV